MLTEDKITEIFVMADEFCKVFDTMLCLKNPIRSVTAIILIPPQGQDKRPTGHRFWAFVSF